MLYFSFPPSFQRKAGLCAAEYPELTQGWWMSACFPCHSSWTCPTSLATTKHFQQVSCLLLIKSILQLLCLSPSLKHSEPESTAPSKRAKGTCGFWVSSETHWWRNRLWEIGENTGQPRRHISTHTALWNWRGRDLPREGAGCAGLAWEPLCTREVHIKVCPIKTGQPVLCGGKWSYAPSVSRSSCRSRLTAEDINPGHRMSKTLPFTPGLWVQSQMTARARAGRSEMQFHTTFLPEPKLLTSTQPRFWARIQGLPVKVCPPSKISQLEILNPWTCSENNPEPRLTYMQI